MPDVHGALASSQQNFIAGGIQGMDPRIGNPLYQMSTDPAGTDSSGHNLGNQEGLSCPADYSKIPYGWRKSAFMGQCGFKLQMRDLYSPSTPCYPIQDLSCMGAVQKKAWAETCKAIFPCRAPPVYAEPQPYRAPPRMWMPHGQSTSLSFSDLMKSVYDYLPIALGGSLAACLFLNRTPKETEEDEQLGAHTGPHVPQQQEQR